MAEGGPGSARSLTGTRIAWELPATDYRYRIEGSTDNSTWTTLADLTATTGTSQVQVSVQVLEISDASTADGGAAIQWPWGDGTNQQWRLLPDSDGSSRLSDVRSGKALQSPGGSAQGDVLNQWTDDGGDNQSWQLVRSETSGYHQLVTVRNGWCADVKDAATADGASVIQWPATGGSNQDWRILAL